MTKKNIWLLVMCLVYVGAGINHFANPAFYLGIMPSWMPYHLELIYLSGLCEIVLGFGVLPLRTRKAASLLIIAMLVAFLSVHIQMLFDTFANRVWLFWIALLRLPLQFVLICWSWLVYRKYHKPFNFLKPVY